MEREQVKDFEQMMKDDPGTPTSLYVLIVTSVVGFLTMILQNFMASRKAKQHREWDVEDRTNAQVKLAQETAKATVELALKTAEENAEIKRLIEQSKA